MTESTPPESGEPTESAKIEIANEEKTLGIIVHLLPFVSSFIGPLIIYFLKKDSSDYVRQQSANVLNFQLFCFVAYIVSFILMAVFIGFLLLPLVGIFWLIFVIIGTIKAVEGTVYKFPITIPIFK